MSYDVLCDVEEQYPSKFRFVAKVIECSNTIFGVGVIVILDESESALTVSASFVEH